LPDGVRGPPWRPPQAPAAGPGPHCCRSEAAGLQGGAQLGQRGPCPAGQAPLSPRAPAPPRPPLGPLRGSALGLPTLSRWGWPLVLGALGLYMYHSPRRTRQRRARLLESGRDCTNAHCDGRLGMRQGFFPGTSSRSLATASVLSSIGRQERLWRQRSISQVGKSKRPFNRQAEGTRQIPPQRAGASTMGRCGSTSTEKRAIGSKKSLR